MTVTNLIRMKKFESLHELPKCDRDRSEQMLLKKTVPLDFLDTGLPQTFDLKKKRKEYQKCNKAECNKRRYL